MAQVQATDVSRCRDGSECGAAALRGRRVTLGIILLFCLCSLLSLSGRTLYVDEKWSLLYSEDVSRGEFRGLLTRDTHPPLSYWIFGKVAGVVGRTSALGLIPICAAGATLWTVQRLASDIDSPEGSAFPILAVALLAANPLFFIYSHCIRMYAFLMLLYSVMTLLLVRFQRHNSISNVAAIAICGVLAFYCHLSGAFFLAFSMALVVLSAETTAVRRHSVVVFLLAGVACVPWLLTLRNNPTIAVVGSVLGPASPAELLRDAYYPVFRFGAGLNVSTTKEMRAWWAVGAAIVAALMALRGGVACSTPGRRITVAMTVLPPACFAVLALVAVRLYGARYLSFALPLYVVLVANGISSIRSRTLRVAAAAFLLASWVIATCLYVSVNGSDNWALHWFSI